MRNVDFGGSRWCVAALLVIGCAPEGGLAPQDAGRRLRDAGDIEADAADVGPPQWDARPPKDAALDADRRRGDARTLDAETNCDQPGVARCDADEPRAILVCGDDGRWARTACDPAEVCREGACERTGQDCEPGERACVDDRVPARCAPGEGWVPLDECTGEDVCAGGACMSIACASAAFRRGSLGCDYWPVDLPSRRYAGPGAANPDAPLGVVLYNPSNEDAARVWLYGPDGEIGQINGQFTMVPPAGDPNVPDGLYQEHVLGTHIRGADGGVLYAGFDSVDALEVPAGGLMSLLVPHGREVAQSSFVDRAAWRLVTDRPMAAYQFSPLCCNYSESNDASLLLPRTALGSRYRHVGVPGQGGLPAALVVVATADETEVTITLPDGVGRAEDEGDRVAWDGRTGTAHLDAHEVLVLQGPIGAATTRAQDLTGTVIESSAPVAAFTSHPCAKYPPDQAGCDHLEEQLFPTNTWGQELTLAPVPIRGGRRLDSEVVYWKLLADEEATTVTFSVPYDGLAPRAPGAEGVPDCRAALTDERTLRLGPGEHCELGTQQAVDLTADHPLSVMGILVGEGATGIASPYGRRAGDPSIFMVAPHRQYRSEYAFLTPGSYYFDYMTIVARAGSVIRLDGQVVDLSGATPVMGSERVYVNVQFGDGPHRIVGDRPFGLTVSAFDDFVSYAFTGGLNLDIE